ncbi:MAG: FdhF/YdeP family oxidoreductase [Halioglobus sp.]
MSERYGRGKSAGSTDVIGGGPKKVLYTLSTLRQIGLGKSAKALTSKNTCKACGLGMGGQHGGMTNELDEFPSVCNKSIQAQSTDIQPAIPHALFDHSIHDFQALSGKEIEHLGRLDTPLLKRDGETRFQPLRWEEALDYAGERFKNAAAERSFFYASGRSSNEAGFVLQLLARLYGTNNVNNCSFYCHQATSVGLRNSIGTGTATVELDDLSQCDLFFIIGANPASNHPRLLHKLQAVRARGGNVVVINPAKEPGLVRFAVPKSPKSMLQGGSWIASEYLQPNIGTDVAVMAGIAKAVVEQGAHDERYLEKHTTGFVRYIEQLETTSWQELGEVTGLSQSQFETVATLYAKSKKAIFAWGMGVTHHTHGVENVEAIANLALLRGMIGKPYSGLLPLRGHSNVQGIGTIGVKPVLASEVLERIEATLSVTLPNAKGMDTLACLEASERGEIDNALIMGGNLFEATPNSKWARGALGKIGFKLFLTTTLNRGHVHSADDGDVMILPVAARDEEPQPTTQESMFNFVRLSDGGIERLQSVRSEVAILCALGQRSAPQHAALFERFTSYGSIRQAIAKTVPGLAELADIEIAKREFHIHGRILHTPTFNTKSGKGAFHAHSLGKPKRNDAAYPHTLMSVRSEGQFNSIVYEESDSYRGTQDRWVVLMGDDDLAQLSLAPGDRVTLTSENGVMEGLAVHRFDLPQGNIMAYYPEANVLTGLARDPRSQTPSFKAVPVSIARC